jgi:hypothetical protein
MDWVKDNCTFSHDTATDYMLLYRKTKNDPKLKEQILQLGITAAKLHLRSLARADPDDDEGSNDEEESDGDGSQKDRGGHSKDISERSKAIKLSERNRAAWSDLYDYFDLLSIEMGEEAFQEYLREELAGTESALIEDFIIRGGEIPIPKMFRDLIEQSPEIGLTTPNVPPAELANFEWMTPPYIGDAAEKSFGVFDCDPAAPIDPAHRTVRASIYFTKDNDGLTQQWHGRVWLNPPYRNGLIPRFVRKLCVELKAGRTTEAIMLTNNATETDWFKKAETACAKLYFPKHRIRFLKPAGDKLTQIGSPGQGQAIFYFGQNIHRFIDFCEMIESDSDRNRNMA